MTESGGVTFSGRIPGPGRRRTASIAGGVLLVLLGGAVALGAPLAPGGSPAGAAPAALADRPPADADVLAEGFAPMGLKGPRGMEERAEPGRHGPRPGQGGPVVGPITVTGIAGTAVTLGTADGWSRTIAVTDATRVFKGDQEVGARGLAIGDRVQLRQERAADGTFTVTAIRIIEPRTGGIVTGVSGSTFTITARDGATRTITVTSTTTFRVGGEAGSWADVIVGAAVMVAGAASGDTFTATAVVVALPRVAGVVTARDAGSLTLKLRNGSTVTVILAETTVVRVRGMESATIADIAVGMVAVVTGTRSGEGSMTARSVHAGALPAEMRGADRGMGPFMPRGGGLHPWRGPEPPQDAPSGQG